jgi:hypothetical protein
MAADFWRVPASVVKVVGGGSVIQDRGVLRHAVPSGGQYLFSEKGAGVQSLALIGLWNEVLNFLAGRPQGGIENRIVDLPEIYMGVSYYRPGQRFTGLFPVLDAVRDISGQLVGLAGGGLGNVLPGPTGVVQSAFSNVLSAIGAVKDGKDALQPVLQGQAKKPNMRLATQEVYIKFSYLPEGSMKPIGRGRIDFPALHGVVRKALSAMA